MAGGQGSGLRMNEAEISRIVGGRSNWESLRATMNKWKTDPTKANSITPAQRQQMNDLVNAVYEKLEKKRQALTDADSYLAGSTDPMEHRHILEQTRRALMDVDLARTHESAAPTQGSRAPGAPPPPKPSPSGTRPSLDDIFNKK
jgi:hypothetical protein